MKLENRLQNQVLVMLLERAPVLPQAQIFHFTFTGAPERRYYAATASLRDTSADLWLVSTLCSQSSNRIFLTITDGDPHVVAGALSGIERYHVEHEPLDHGHTVPMPHPPLIERGIVAALFLRPRVSLALAEFPDHASFGDHHAHFFLVVFLDEREYDLKKQQGLDALLDVFESKQKDLIRFGSST